MRYLKIIILGLIATSLMGIGPLIGKNDRDDKVRSSYMILCFKNSMLAGAGSGNHFKIRDQKFVLTAAHVIESCDEVKLIEYDSQTYNLKTVVVDDTLDYAVLKPERELPLKPAKFYRTSPKIAMGIDMVSWPSDYGMVYTTGHLAGSQNLSYYIQTFCWLGSSGASVFADDGSFLGVLHGIKVGYYDPAMPPQLLNGICLVRPLSTISDKDIYEALRDYDGGEARHINH
jgi:hypothetical protein